MVKRLIKQAAYRVAPVLSAEVDERWWVRKNTRQLLKLAKTCRTPLDFVLALEQVPAFRPSQKRSEIVRLLTMVAGLQVQRMCEIGTSRGGSLFLFAQMCAPSARIVSVDLAYPKIPARAFPCFAKKGQRLVCLQRNSQALETRDYVKNLFCGEQLDFLFIDGDHSYEGVKRDFELYSPLVRPGGLVAFHDIVPDFESRFGTPSKSQSGQVPRFWKEIKNIFPDTLEFIDNRDQDGFGIGVVRWSSLK